MPDNSPDLLRRPFRFYIKRHWILVALGTLSLFFTNLMDSLIPTLTGMTIDKITGEKPLSEVGQMVGVIFGVILIMSVFRFAWRFFWSTFHHTVAEDLRDRLFARIVNLGPSFFRP